MLLVLFEDEACLQERRVFLVANLEEAADDHTDVLHVRPEILLVEAEFIAE